MRTISLEKLAHSVRNPLDVQNILYDIEYSRKDSMRSALMVWKMGRAHCLEAVHLAAYLLESRGFPTLALSLDSADNICHVVYPFKTPKGWGSIGLSKEPGLHGRAAQFRNLKELALSYFDPYVDDTGRLTGYALLNLEDSKCDWRFSLKNVWKSEKHILRAKHSPVLLSEKRFERAFKAYTNGGHKPQNHWR